ncbi:DUF2599 domain-containing protein [Erysipelothrix rhusiopathiae]|nr:DUF2599 domain-containing protein [Erysipelothrix rhusiopathiae]MDE8051568.1 DUF2599 domain-containing protein [Erysipelothrix rhusiopathiae]MDE8060754.1 DUF2599 domain-containing protein [Erysipelothrix rhusiopathiae]MDE8065699.1 DUF2599 domain-containing protein [Erysipelothrix rhusiopathiae]MDE8128586.1 DUF2599 domain-containing protein [Erysipelothrix rhusiopathiae]
MADVKIIEADSNVDYGDSQEVYDTIDPRDVTEVIVLYNEGDGLLQEIIDYLPEYKVKYSHRSVPFNSHYTYFKSVSWVRRFHNESNQYEWTLSLVPKNPKSLGPNNLGGVAWSTVIQNYAYDSHPTMMSINNPTGKAGSMYNQYVCHYNFANSKPQWNLEPRRKNVGAIKNFLNGCNSPFYN